MSDSRKEEKIKMEFSSDVVDGQRKSEGEDQENGGKHTTDDLSENLNALKERAAQLEDHLRRAVADNENVKRIMQKQISNASDYSVTQFARDIIDSCDNLKRVIKILKDGDPVHAGIKVSHQKIMNDLKKHGIEEIDPIGQSFDTNLHQAVVEREDDEKENGTILEVLQTGFTIKGRLLRPAMVVISKKSSTIETIEK